jgi:uncharacterized protein YjbI with pentapeptide repeats
MSPANAMPLLISVIVVSLLGLVSWGSWRYRSYQQDDALMDAYDRLLTMPLDPECLRFGSVFSLSRAAIWFLRRGTDQLKQDVVETLFAQSKGRTLYAQEFIERYDAGERDFGQVDLAGANLAGADLSGASLVAADLSGVNLEGTDLGGADLYAVNLQGAILVAVDLRRADLRRSKLCSADLREAYLQGADLREANLAGAIMPDGRRKGLLTQVRKFTG